MFVICVFYVQNYPTNRFDETVVDDTVDCFVNFWKIQEWYCRKEKSKPIETYI